MNICLTAPIGSLVAVMDPPLFMQIFPRERFGQFCSANSLCRSVGSMTGGALIGLFLDTIRTHWGADTAYRMLPLWNLTWVSVALFAMTRLYRSWKRHGGDAAYVPPLGSFLRQPQPFPAAEETPLSK
jgi:hypothetical protein